MKSLTLCLFSVLALSVAARADENLGLARFYDMNDRGNIISFITLHITSGNHLDTATVLNRNTGKVKFEDVFMSVQGMELSRNGKYLAIRHSNELSVIDIKNGGIIFVATPFVSEQFEFSGDSNFIVFASSSDFFGTCEELFTSCHEIYRLNLETSLLELVTDGTPSSNKVNPIVNKRGNVIGFLNETRDLIIRVLGR